MRKFIPAVLFALALGVGTVQAAEIVVKVAPPKVLVEKRGPAPSRDHVWISGYHRWDGDHYVWEKGRWEVPPRPHAKWIAPRWIHRRDGYVFSEGRWR